MKKYVWKSFAAVVIGALRVNGVIYSGNGTDINSKFDFSTTAWRISNGLSVRPVCSQLLHHTSGRIWLFSLYFVQVKTVKKRKKKKKKINIMTFQYIYDDTSMKHNQWITEFEHKRITSRWTKIKELQKSTNRKITLNDWINIQNIHTSILPWSTFKTPLLLLPHLYGVPLGLYPSNIDICIWNVGIYIWSMQISVFIWI